MRRSGKQGTGFGLRRASLLALFAVAAFASLASPASGAGTHPFISAFGPDGTSATKFIWPSHVAVDQQAHLLYVVDKNEGNNSRLYRFTTAGVPNNFTAGPGAGTNLAKIPFAGEVAVAPAGSPGATAGDVYLLVEGKVNVYSPQGALLGTIDGSGNP
ncbi:MAG TPA: hypothetical protein VHQ43_10495, partial [Solirubrobacterales bacterium]|nr:hypothetical protein [Solirubrobacterales bacterium]